MRSWLLLIAGFALGGCMAQRMASLVHHPIDEVVARFGPPARAEAIMADTRRYVWTRRQDLRPGPAPHSTFMDIKSGEFRRARRDFNGNWACEFQLIARYKPDRHAWIVQRMITPPALCT